MKSIIIILTVLFSINASAQRFEEKKIVGYIPSWKSSSEVDYSNLTHAMYGFINPDEEGSIPEMPNWQKPNFDEFLNRTEPDSIKRFISLGGANGFDLINNIAQDSNLIHTFVDTLISFCQYHEIDGVDIDWEGLSNDTHTENFSRLIDTLDRRLDLIGLEMSITLPPTAYLGQHFETSALEKADWLQIMVYDYTGTWTASPFGQHSSLSHVVGAKIYWNSRGFGNDMLVVGVPFYGRKFESRRGGIAQSVPYHDIAIQYPMLEETIDQSPDDGLTFFNGPETIRRKSQYIMDNDFAGIMIWDMTLDATGHKSLHKQIICTFDSSACPVREICSGVDTTGGLIAHFKLDGDAVDATENIQSVPLLTDVGYNFDRFAQEQKAVDLEDLSQIDFGTHPDFELDNHTVSMWVNTEKDDQEFQILLSRWAEGEDNYSYILFLYNNRLAIQYFMDEPNEYGYHDIWFISNPTITKNNWHHIVESHDSIDGTKLYINGLRVLSDDTQFNIDPKSHLSLILGNPYVNDMPFAGRIDELKIYDRVLSQCDIDALFYDHYDNQSIPVGIEEGQSESNFSVYPNPAHEFITVEGEDFAKIEIYSLSGVKVMDSDSERIDISSLENGLYSVVVTDLHGNQKSSKLAVE